MRNDTPTISLCMIVKNEEQWITKALSSVESIVSEMIVVDTGSTDDTVALAEKAGAKVFHEEWTDDFSAARNVSLAHATGDWILVLDADEEIAPSDLEKLVKLTTEPSAAYLLTQRHYVNDYTLSRFEPVVGEYVDMERHYGGYCTSSLTRFFPNHCGYEFRGPVCELVEPSITEKQIHEIRDAGIPIHHYGYAPEYDREQRKAALYSKIGEERIKAHPDSWRALFELGVDYLVSANFQKSIQCLVQSLEKNGSHVPTWVNLGFSLLQMGQLADAQTTFETAVTLDPRSHEAQCNLGVCQLHQRNYEAAEESFFRSVALKPNYVNAYVNLGKTLTFQGRYAEAACIYEKALSVLPSCAVAKIDLSVLFYSAAEFEKAEGYLKSASFDEPQNPQVHLYLAQLYEAMGREADKEEALKAFARVEMKQVQDLAGQEKDALSCYL